MDFRILAIRFLKAIFLVFTGLTIAATSMVKDSYTINGSYFVASDCVSPAVQTTVTATSGTVTAPSGVSFTDFGFPDATISFNTPVTGTSGLATRVCEVGYGEDGGDDESKTDNNQWLFSCFDNGAYACTIYMKPN